jgi:hypothetical protein
VVFAQCYGGLFAAQINKFNQNPKAMEIIGLSDGTTCSSLTSDQKVSQSAVHNDLVAWFAATFQGAKDSDVKAKQGDGAGALLQLSTN